ncbi:MAG: hypothetical protein ACRDBG_06140 [Waterburya sp.]
MTTATLDLKATEIQFGAIEYIEDPKTLKDFVTPPAVVYIRGEVDKSKEATEEYKAELTSGVDSEGKTIIQIVNPLLWFSLSVDELAQTDLVGILLPDTKYLVNGNNRVNAVGSFTRERDQNQFRYMPTPTQRLTGAITLDGLLSLQHKLNDTTKKHDSFSMCKAIKEAHGRFVTSGMVDAEATKRCCAVFNVDQSYVGQALKLDESNEAFKPLWELKDSNIIQSADVMTGIRQAIEAYEPNLDPVFVASSLLKFAIERRKGNKPLQITKTLLQQWRKDYDAELVKNAATPAVENPKTSAGKKDKPLPTPEEINESAAKLQDSMQVFMTVNTNLAEQTDSNVEKRHVYKNGLKHIGKIAARLSTIVPTDSAEIVYRRLSAALQEAMAEMQFSKQLTGTDKVQFARDFGTLANGLNELFASSEKRSNPTVDPDFPESADPDFSDDIDEEFEEIDASGEVEEVEETEY